MDCSPWEVVPLAVESFDVTALVADPLHLVMTAYAGCNPSDLAAPLANAYPLGAIPQFLPEPCP